MNKNKLLLLVATLGFSVSSIAGTNFNKLSSAEQNQVLVQGKQLAKLKDIAGQPWPEITLSQWSSEAPEQVCGVFADFAKHKQYMGDMLKSEVRKVSKNTFDVDYVIKVPVVSNEAYTVRNVLSSYDNGNSYKVSWNLVKATRTEASRGHFACEAVSGGTFISYNNFVNPGLNNFIARQIFNKALAKVKATPYTVLKQLKKDLAGNPALVERQAAALRSAVAR